MLNILGELRAKARKRAKPLKVFNTRGTLLYRNNADGKGDRKKKGGIVLYCPYLGRINARAVFLTVGAF